MKVIRQEQRSGLPLKEDWITLETMAGPAGEVARRLSLSNCLHTDFDREIERDVLQGLCGGPKTLPSKYFYDARGSKLFEEICCLPEYYPTRTEISILSASAPAIMSFFERGAGDLVEIGCGADLKIRRLLEIADRHVLSRIRYVPLDISADCLLQSARRLLAAFGPLRIHALIADFTRHLDRLPRRRKMVVFFGGTYGNFTPQEGIDLLVRLAERMGPEDRLILGLDMIKEKQILEAAYNDAQGVTAAFNLNILSHINSRLGADFDAGSFEHLAFWNEDQERIEMHLKAVRDVAVHVPRLARTFSLHSGETIQTEISQKFSRSSAQERFGKAGLHVEAWHTDAAGWFCLVQLRKSQATEAEHP